MQEPGEENNQNREEKKTTKRKVIYWRDSPVPTHLSSTLDSHLSDDSQKNIKPLETSDTKLGHSMNLMLR